MVGGCWRLSHCHIRADEEAAEGQREAVVVVGWREERKAQGCGGLVLAIASRLFRN